MPASYDLELMNAGRCDGEVSLVTCSQQGWDVLPVPSHTLPSGGSKWVTVGPVVPSDAPGGTVDVTLITATLTCGSSCTGTAVATATAAVTTTLIPISPTNVAITGPTAGSISTTYAFTASVGPVTANRPITYIWRATGQSDVVTMTNAPSHTVLYTWGAEDTQSIVVTAINSLGTVSDAHAITVTAPSHEIYMPLVLRNWPPSPVLQPVSNPDGVGSYDVCWTADWGNLFVLEEAADSAFTGAAEVYRGPDTCGAITGNGAARYYYRVKACLGSTWSGWSSVEQVDVLWEAEPNDDAPGEANGPIVSGLTYFGTLAPTTDIKDYFYFALTDPHSVEIWLTDIPAGHNYDLCLRYPSLDAITCSCSGGNESEHILTDELSTGLYYVQVYNRSHSESTHAYHLRVVYR